MHPDIEHITGRRVAPMTIDDLEAVPALRGLIVFANPRQRIALLMRFGAVPGGRDKDAIAEVVGIRPNTVWSMFHDLTRKYRRIVERRHDRPPVMAPSVANFRRRISEVVDADWRIAQARAEPGYGYGVRRMLDADAP